MVKILDPGFVFRSLEDSCCLCGQPVVERVEEYIRQSSIELIGIPFVENLWSVHHLLPVVIDSTTCRLIGG